MDSIDVGFDEGPLKLKFKGIAAAVENTDIILVAGFDSEGGTGPAEASGKIAALDCLAAVNGKPLAGMSFKVRSQPLASSPQYYLVRIRAPRLPPLSPPSFPRMP